MTRLMARDLAELRRHAEGARDAGFGAQVDPGELLALIDELIRLREMTVYRSLARPKKCADCRTYRADYPSTLCPGCEAYREHMA